MTTLTGRYVILTEQEYRVLVEDAKANREKTMTEEERQIVAEALSLYKTHAVRQMIEAHGGTINGRVLADRRRVISHLMARFEV